MPRSRLFSNSWTSDLVVNSLAIDRRPLSDQAMFGSGSILYCKNSLENANYEHGTASTCGLALYSSMPQMVFL